MKHIQPNTDAEKQKELDKETFYLNIERPEPAERLDADVKNWHGKTESWWGKQYSWLYLICLKYRT